MKDYFEITHEVSGYVSIEKVEEIYGRKFTDKEISLIRKDLETLFPEVDQLYKMEVDNFFECGDDEFTRQNINTILFDKYDYKMYEEDGKVSKNVTSPPTIEHDWF